MDIFQKGDYKPISQAYRVEALSSLNELSDFQAKYGHDDTDTLINEIRDSIVAHYLGYDLINTQKHGFDAKMSKEEKFLEVKQCSISSRRWGGTWNDTNVEKANAFKDKRLFTAIGIWKYASNLQMIIYGQNSKVGDYLIDRINNRKEGSRSTQNIAVEKFIKEYNFSVLCPPDKSKAFVYNLLLQYHLSLKDYIKLNDIKSI